MVIPILDIVFWHGNLPQCGARDQHGHSSWHVIGQVVVGILGDRYGRKRMYGALLIVMIVGCVPLAALDRGPAENINVLAWVISWRCCLGLAPGGDYPLT
jgi:PHS family inorganic phosphate transporter-like MFS transporter